MKDFMIAEALEFKYLKRDGEKVVLNDKDKTKMKELYNSISNQAEGEMIIKFEEIIWRIESKYESKYSQVFRNNSNEVTGFVDCSTISKVGNTKKHIRVNALALDSGANDLQMLVKTLNDFKTSAKNEGFKYIIFNGLNSKLNSFLATFGFKHIGESIYICNL